KAVIESNSSIRIVAPPANTNVFTMSRANGSWSSTAWTPCSVHWSGRMRAGSAYRSLLVRKATPSIHRNGITIASAPTMTTSQDRAAASRPSRRPTLRGSGPGAAALGGVSATSENLVIVSVGIAVPRDPQLDGRDDQDDEEQHPGDRARVAHLEVH